jgi:Uma2 family endonuclease
MTTTARLTLEQFLEIPEQKPALEFDADGTIHEKMSPNTEHSGLQVHIGHLLLTWIDVDPPRRRGYVYSELRTNVAGASKLPDVAFYRRRPRESERKHALELADVSIEILSPRDDLDDQLEKCKWYIDQGSETAMLIDPEQRSVTLFSPGGQVEMLAPPAMVRLLPDLELGLTEIFRVLEDEQD